MPVYNQFPRLYEQNNQSATTQYYGGLNRRNPLSMGVANQTIANTSTPSPTTRSTATPQNPYGSVGQNVLNGIGGQNDYYNQNGSWTDDTGNTHYSYELKPEYADYRDMIQVGELRQPDGSFARIRDSSQVTYDPRFGWVTRGDNVHNPQTWENALPWVLTAAGAGMAGAAFSGMGAGSGAGTGAWGLAGESTAADLAAYQASMAGNVATPLASSALPVGTDLSAGATTLTANGAVNSAVPASGTLATAAGAAPLSGGTMPTMTDIFVNGYGPAAQATAGGSVASGSFPWRSAFNLAGGLANNYLAGRNQDQYDAAANRADPWGQQNREEAQRRLWELYKDPSSIENTPGYQFARSQGEQGINRAAASKGYFRSPNMLFDLSKFNQGLAESTYDKEVQRLMAMSGVQFDPGNAAAIQARGIGQGTNMRAAGLTQLISSGGEVLSWLFGGG